MTATTTKLSLALVGAGKMGGTLLSGWLDRGLDPSGLCVVDPQPSGEISSLCNRLGIRLNPSSQDVGALDVLVLAVKPQSFDAAAQQIAAFVRPGVLALSIMAGKTIADLSARLGPQAAIVRAMPNTPAAVRRGISGAVCGAGVTSRQKDIADGLLSAVGSVEWLADENLMNAVTAVSGSGPAYVFLLAECLAAAGVAAGLPEDVSLRLARATVEGAGALMSRAAAVAPGDLRRNVTSPGGTTAAALEVLMGAPGLEDLMRRAVAAATRRGEELSG